MADSDTGTRGTATRDDDSFAVMAWRDAGRWQCELLPGWLSVDLDGLVAALRQQPAETGALGFVDVADEFFVAIRAGAGPVRLLLSDVGAAVAWDLARDVAARLGVSPPEEEDLDDVWPAGDLSMFADLGLDEMELGAILADLDAYADEMLMSIARRLGFDDAFRRVVEAALR